MSHAPSAILPLGSALPNRPGQAGPARPDPDRSRRAKAQGRSSALIPTLPDKESMLRRRCSVPVDAKQGAE